MSLQNEGMPRHEMLLLVNAERFILALDHKTKWELEVDRLQDQLVKLKN